MRAVLLVLALLQTTAQLPAAPPQEVSVPPKILTRVLPSYFALEPTHSLQAPLPDLDLDCTVDVRGQVTDVRIVTPVVLLDTAAVLAAETVSSLKKWTFTPARKGGVAVSAVVHLAVRFFEERRPTRGGPGPGPFVWQPTLSIEGADDDFEAGAFPLKTPGLTPPREKKFTAPMSVADAIRRGITGTVVLDAVVMPDGTVGRARVTHPVDPELDAEALRTVKKWLFEPGRKDGQPVAVLVTLEVMFRRGSSSRSRPAF